MRGAMGVCVIRFCVHGEFGEMAGKAKFALAPRRADDALPYGGTTNEACEFGGKILARVAGG